MLDVARYPGDGAARAHAGNQRVNGAVGVFPDFRAGGFFVDRRVGRVFKLLQQDIGVRVLSCQFLGLLDRAFHALGGFGQNQLGAERL